MILKNINPLGEVDVPGIGTLEPGGEFEVTDPKGRELLKQAGNYEQVDAKKEKAK